MSPRTTAPRRQSLTRSERFEARISGEQKDLFVRAAGLQDRTLNDFVVVSVLETAVRTIEAMASGVLPWVQDALRDFARV